MINLNENTFVLLTKSSYYKCQYKRDQLKECFIPQNWDVWPLRNQRQWFTVPEKNCYNKGGMKLLHLYRVARYLVCMAHSLFWKTWHHWSSRKNFNNEDLSWSKVLADMMVVPLTWHCKLFFNSQLPGIVL